MGYARTTKNNVWQVHALFTPPSNWSFAKAIGLEPAQQFDTSRTALIYSSINSVFVSPEEKTTRYARKNPSNRAHEDPANLRWWMNRHTIDGQDEGLYDIALYDHVYNGQVLGNGTNLLSKVLLTGKEITLPLDGIS